MSHCKSNTNSAQNSVTYTKSTMDAAVKNGVMGITNNAYMGQSYATQLQYQPSLQQMKEQVVHEQPEIEFETNVQDQEEDNRGEEQEMIPDSYIQKMKLYEDMKNKYPEVDEAPQPCKSGNSFSTNALARIELLKIVQKFGGGEAMFDSIETWATHWTGLDADVFKTDNAAQKWPRSKTLNHVKEALKLNDLEPNIHQVTLHDNRKVSVPVVDFASSMRSVLDDPRVMAHVMKGLDPDTYRPILSHEEMQNNPDAIILDKDSGYLYWEGIKLHCPDSSTCDETLVRPFPIIIHIDKSHSDLFGNLAVAPVQVMPAMFDVDMQQQVKAWRQISTIPNLSSGKGKDGKKSSDALNKLRDYHKVLGVALSSFKETYENGGFYWKDPVGRNVLLKPYIHCVVGDMAGVNEMVGHYNNCQANCLIKDCKCSQKDYLDFPCNCEQITWRELQECSDAEEVFDLFHEKGLVSERDMHAIRTDVNLAKEISKHNISNAFDDLPLADAFQGIIGLTPQEMLHMMGCGMFKYLILGVKNIIGANGKNSRVKGLVNQHFPDVKEFLTRNAEKDICRMSNRVGMFNVTSLTNDEIRGNFVGLVTFMHTTYGRALLKPFFDAKSVDFNEMLETAALVLSWERFYLDGQKRKDIEEAEAVTQDLMMRIVRDFPREPKAKTKHSPGSKGWYIAKFHGMRFQSINNLKFGCAKTFNSDCNEKNHKYFVKENAKRTQRRQQLFSIQLAVADWNRVVIDLAYERIKVYSSKDHSPNNETAVTTSLDRQTYNLSDDDNDEDDTYYYHPNATDNTNITRLYGYCHLNIRVNPHNQVSVTHKWKAPLRNKLNIHPSVHLHRTISGHATDMRLKYKLPRSTEINVDAYTNATVNGHRYRANPYWKGSPWYDWACVKFPETVTARGGDKSVCRVMGFFTYNDKGALTPKHLDVLSLLPDEITDTKDDSVYVVLHCQTQFFSFHRLEHQFMRKFQMMDESKMYILPASCLVAPVLVVPDIEDADTVSKTRFMAMLPRHKMGMFFCNHVHWFVRQRNNCTGDESEVESSNSNEYLDELDMEVLPSDSDEMVTSSEDSDSIESNSDEEVLLQLTTAGDENLLYGDNW